VVTDSQDYPRPRSKGIYLLPNLLTTGCLFSGFYAVVAAIDKHFDHAGMGVFAAMIFDTLDGRTARLTHTESFFGKEYDSLADMVAFGVAPAIVAYQWGVVRIAEYGHPWGRFGWLACFLFRGIAEPLSRRDRGGIHMVRERLARAGAHRADRRFHHHGERRRPHGEPFRLSEF
jgi:phosphatidylglycerophosphate synthase